MRAYAFEATVLVAYALVTGLDVLDAKLVGPARQEFVELHLGGPDERMKRAGHLPALLKPVMRRFSSRNFPPPSPPRRKATGYEEEAR
jgi:hypothetical protein